MTKIAAFIDASSYAHSVCDHAAWVAARMAASVEILHAIGRRDGSGAAADFSGALTADARDTLLAELSAWTSRTPSSRRSEAASSSIRPRHA